MKRLILLSAVAVLLASCGNGTVGSINDKRITVGASSTPHAQILNQTKTYIESKGYELDIRVMTDYVTPNISLRDGDLDANYFQHEPYLADFNENYHTELVSVEKIHFEPMSVFQGKNMTSKKIAIPNDKSNGDRARALLEEHKYDLALNLSVFEIIEVEASVIPTLKNDVSYLVVNGNYALESGLLDIVTPLFRESTESEVAKRLANIIAVRKGDENADSIKVLVEALKQENIKTFINEKYKGAVIPMF